MSSLVVKVEYADLPFISDRTARSILKDLSKAVRQAQTIEVEQLLRTANVGRRDRQSINDRLRRPLQEGAVYYVEELRAGSLQSTITMSAFALWLLNITVGETIKDAWRAAPIHQAVIDYIEKDRSDEFPRILVRALRDRKLLTGRAFVVDVTVEQEDGDTIIHVFVASEPEAEIEAEKRIEGQDVVEMARQALDRLDIDEQDKNGEGGD